MNAVKVYVYVAGPYSIGDKNENVKKAITAADELSKIGFVPFVPHLTHYWDAILPHEYKFWMDYDSQWLKKCDALLRLPGESKGADLEVQICKEQIKIPVFYSVAALEQSYFSL